MVKHFCLFWLSITLTLVWVYPGQIILFLKFIFEFENYIIIKCIFVFIFVFNFRLKWFDEILKSIDNMIISFKERNKNKEELIFVIETEDLVDFILETQGCKSADIVYNFGVSHPTANKIAEQLEN